MSEIAQMLYKLHPEAFKRAQSRFTAYHSAGVNLDDCIARVICDFITEIGQPKEGASYTELPLEEKYEDIQERAIAMHERRRALAIIGAHYNNLELSELMLPSELLVFLSSISVEIDGF